MQSMGNNAREHAFFLINGACLLITKRKKRFYWSHILLQLVEVYFDPNVETQYRIFSIEFWKVPIGYCITRYSTAKVANTNTDGSHNIIWRVSVD